MVEIAYTSTVKKRDEIPHMDIYNGRITTDVKYTVFKAPHKVALTRSTMVVGIPRGTVDDPYKYKDKRYYKWQATNSMGIRRNAADNLMGYYCTRPWKATVGQRWTHGNAYRAFEALNEEVSYEIDEKITEAYRKAVWEVFGITKIQDVFPMLDLYELPRYELIPHNLRMAFRANNWQEFTARAFGKTRVTPRLVAAVQNTEPYFVAYANQFRGLVDNEKLVKFLETNHFNKQMEENFRVHSPLVRDVFRKEDNTVTNKFIELKFDQENLDALAGLVSGLRFARQITASPKLLATCTDFVDIAQPWNRSYRRATSSVPASTVF